MRVLALAWALTGCLAGPSDASLVESPPPQVWTAPEALGGGPVPAPARNPTTHAGVALGERLFSDPRLSADHTVSCATCHDPERAFTDGRRFSVGVSGRPLKRNTPTLLNVAFRDGLFWDGGAKNLESQAFAPLTHEDEMGVDLEDLRRELAADAEVAALFAAAFDDGVTVANLARALAQFQRTLFAADARYDRFVGGDPDALTAAERDGLRVFRQRCAGCHVEPLFTDDRYHDVGLDTEFSEDHERLAWGRGRITGDPRDQGRYKTPTLRNVARTAPYMHDGRFTTLEEAVEHYRSGVVRSPALDPRLRTGDRPGLPLTDDEVAALVAFLGALTDA